MNKQQLASKIWESANNMRSKIEANEYKDYILGFIFYKFLSNKEINTLKQMGLEESKLSTITEENTAVVSQIKQRIGYFISYENLFSTWVNMGVDFDISNVRFGLSAFNRLISQNHKKVFEGIFQTLETGLSKLGDTSKAQTKFARDLILLINDIPMDGKQDYDVLGFIYEYLISNFAANAGKKAGEFYTPHEVSLLMSEIIADFLKDRENIEIYDPTSGSGSLLINIGQSASKYIKGKNKIKYYAQELKQNTFNLTRMNLVMRGILPENIVVRNGDTLAEDWPFFDENHSYSPLFVDAVVSNPPYSQKWNPENADIDSRFNDYGIAPKGKADYAFLLHDLYHLKPSGIMTIVLPHGVLFRGGEEATIRKNLIEKNNIDVIIGLPANIFFGTGIPTIVMVLKKERKNTDVLIVDASKGFIKEGKNNKLRACDIKKIADAVIQRVDVPKFSRKVSREEIRNNEYNLNIPRYVDSSPKAETFDIYAQMFGGIPNNEIEDFSDFFKLFPDLKKELFSSINDEYSEIKHSNVGEFIKNHRDVLEFKKEYEKSFNGFDKELNELLLGDIQNANINNMENIISNSINSKIEKYEILDKYKAYQVLDDEWKEISGDLEIIQNEGLSACKIVDPVYKIAKKDGKDIEIQDGLKGRIIPFDLVQKLKLKEELIKIKEKEERISEITSSYSEIIEDLSADDRDSLDEVLNEEGDAFVPKEIIKKVKELKKCKVSLEDVDKIIIRVSDLIEEEKEIKKEIKTLEGELILKTKNVIENLSDKEVNELLAEKWITPILSGLESIPNEMINSFEKQIINLSNKYQTTLVSLEDEIKKVELELSNMIDELVGNEFDMKGLEQFKALLGG